MLLVRAASASNNGDTAGCEVNAYQRPVGDRSAVYVDPLAAAISFGPMFRAVAARTVSIANETASPESASVITAVS